MSQLVDEHVSYNYRQHPTGLKYNLKLLNQDIQQTKINKTLQKNKKTSN